GRTSQMAIDHQALFRPLTKHTTRLRADGVRSILFDAARVALAERPGSVHVGLPVGMSAEQASAESCRFVPPAPPAAGDPALLSAALERFEKSRKPLLAVGLGAARAGAGERVRNLAEKHNLPVVLTPMAKGLLPEDHRCYAGVLFHALSDVVGLTHRESDLVIAIGYDPVEFNYESWMPPVPLVSIDTAPADIDTNVYPDVVDVAGAIPASLDAFLALAPKQSGWDLRRVAERRQEMFARLAPAPGSFGPKAALEVLREVLPP